MKQEANIGKPSHLPDDATGVLTTDGFQIYSMCICGPWYRHAYVSAKEAGGKLGKDVTNRANNDGSSRIGKLLGNSPTVSSRVCDSSNEGNLGERATALLSEFAMRKKKSHLESMRP
jgi:hypothetical protein